VIRIRKRQFKQTFSTSGVYFRVVPILEQEKGGRAAGVTAPLGWQAELSEPRVGLGCEALCDPILFLNVLS
jgi:hypothetical protein